MINLLKKLKKTSLAELSVRGVQAAHIYAERRSWSPQSKLIDDDAFFKLLSTDRFQGNQPLEYRDYFRTRSEPVFFEAFTDYRATIAEFRRRWPGAEERIVAEANRVVAGSFDLLGLRDLAFGDPIDWHLEPVAGKRAPAVHWSRLDFLDASVAGDKKITWELNRHQHFNNLGQAYWFTGDESYAQAFASQINSWMDQNPPKLGINWASSLEIAFRSISWIWALHFFKNAEALTAQTFLRIEKFLYTNARHLETYLSTYFSPNTHLTGEALGLFYLGTHLPEVKESARWRNIGLKILTEQLSKHVKPDGVYFEQSTYYHRYTTDFYLHLWILLAINGEPAPEGLKEKLELLLDHLMFITRPDGTTPFFGDDDGGRLIKLDQRPANDFRATLSTAAALFERPDYKFVAGETAAETLWLLGPEGLAKLDLIQAREPARQSVAFDDGGYYVMRDGWTPTSNYLIFDCGPHGVHNCGHAHADALSFELAANGRSLLVDPGTYTYTGSKGQRDWFRGSLAHNALTVDGESSSATDGPFSWRSIASAASSAWFTGKRFDYVEGTHNGYQRLQAPVTHRRSILFLRHGYWIVRDQVSSDSEHLYQLRFHLDSELDGRIDSQNELLIHETPQLPELKIFGFAADGHWDWEDAAVSHCYGTKERAASYVFSAKAASETLVTFLLPRTAPIAGVKGDLAQWLAREVEATGGRAFEVASEIAVDLVMLAEGQRVETSRMASDFRWTWARFLKDADVPEELVLIDGQSLELEGRKIFTSDERINYLSAKREGDQFRIETNGRINDSRFADLEAVVN